MQVEFYLLLMWAIQSLLTSCFFREGDFGPLLTFLISLLRLSTFFTFTAQSWRVPQILFLLHVFPPTSLNLHVRALQGQLSRLETQLSFRYRGHLIKLLGGIQHVHNMQPLHRQCCFVPGWEMGKYLPCGQELWIQRGDLCGKKSMIFVAQEHWLV